jgi:predicted dehydrogenase
VAVARAWFIGTLRRWWTAPDPSVAEAFSSYPDEDCYIVAGTLGSLAFPTMRLRFYADPARRSWSNPFESETIAIERADPLTRQLENFCAVIRGTAEPVVSARDGLQNLRVLDAIQRAARSGQASTVAQ